MRLNKLFATNLSHQLVEQQPISFLNDKNGAIVSVTAELSMKINVSIFLRVNGLFK